MTSRYHQQGLLQLAEGRGERACPPGETDGAAGEVQGAFREDEPAVELANSEGPLAGWSGAAEHHNKPAGGGEVAGGVSSKSIIVVSSLAIVGTIAQ